MTTITLSLAILLLKKADAIITPEGRVTLPIVHELEDDEASEFLRFANMEPEGLYTDYEFLEGDNPVVEIDQLRGLMLLKEKDKKIYKITLLAPMQLELCLN